METAASTLSVRTFQVITAAPVRMASSEMNLTAQVNSHPFICFVNSLPQTCLCSLMCRYNLLSSTYLILYRILMRKIVHNSCHQWQKEFVAAYCKHRSWVRRLLNVLMFCRVSVAFTPAYKCTFLVTYFTGCHSSRIFFFFSANAVPQLHTDVFTF